MRYAHIVGWGKHVPAGVVTNDDLAGVVDTSDEWIRKMTGIGERRVAGRRDTSASMAIAAAVQALDVAGISGTQLDLIVVATSTPEHAFPSVACAVQDALGASRAGAFDLSAACSGFVYALGLAADGIKAGAYHHVLVIGSEAMSRIVDWKDRNTCVLFGDGAGAVVVSSSDQPGGVLSTLLRADGSGGDVLVVRDTAAGGEITLPGLTEPLPPNRTAIQMNGREVFRFATRVIDRATRDVMHRVGWLPDQVDLIVPHQANIRIIESAAKSLGIAMDRFYCNIERYGNTSAASIPIALCDAVAEGRLRPSDRLVMVGFGAGLTWAATAVQWGAPRALSQRQKVLNRVGYSIAGIRSRARRVLRNLETRIDRAPGAAHRAAPEPKPADPPPARAPHKPAAEARPAASDPPAPGSPPAGL